MELAYAQRSALLQDAAFAALEAAGTEPGLPPLPQPHKRRRPHARPDQRQADAVPIVAETAGTLWKIVAAPGAAQARDATLVIIESMKMEIPVEAPADGYVVEYRVTEGSWSRKGRYWLSIFLPINFGVG